MKNQLLLTPIDVWQLIKRKRGWIYLGSTIVALLGFFFALFCTPKFKAEGLFRDKKGAQREPTGTGESTVLSLLSPLDADNMLVLSLMRSKRVMENAIAKSGLQVKFKPTSRSLLLFKNVKDNILGEIATFSKSFTKVVDLRFHPIFMEKVDYSEYKPLSLHIHFVSEDTFEIIQGKKIIANGRVDQTVNLENASFIVRKKPMETLLGKSFSFTIEPMQKVMLKAQKKIKLIQKRKEKEFISISYKHPDPNQACLVVNAMMDAYNEYLQESYENITDKQIAFLRQKSQKSMQDLETLFEQSAEHSVAEITDGGFIDSAHAMQFYLEPQKKLKTKLLQIEMEIKRLAKSKPGAFLQTSDPTLLQFFEKSYDRMKDLEVQRKGLLVNLDQSKMPSLQQKLEKLEEIRLQLQRYERLKSLPGVEVKLLQKLNPDLHFEAMDRAALNVHFDQKLHFLQLKEKIALEELHFVENSLQKLHGMSIESAHKLLGEYNQQIDQKQLARKQYQKLIQGMNEGNFEVATLSRYLTDATSQAILQKAGDMVLHLQDDQNYSTKEKMRMRHLLNVQKKAMYLQLQDLIEFTQLEIDALKEKNQLLQHKLLDLMNQKIALLKQEVDDTKSQQINNLKQEAELVKTDLSKLEQKLVQLPKRKFGEKKFLLQQDISNQVIKTLYELTETKSVSSALNILESGPLDPAKIPPRPIYPGICLLTFAGGIIGAIFSMVILMIAALISGFLVSPSLIRLNGGTVLGVVEGNNLKPLVLKALAKLKQSKRVYCITPSNVEMGEMFCESLTLKGQKSLHLVLGLIGQSIDDWKIKPSQSGSVDRVMLNLSDTKNALQFLLKNFEKRLNELDEKYDHIVIESLLDLSNPALEALCNLSTQPVFSLSNQKMQQLDQLSAFSKEALFLLQPLDTTSGF